MVDLEARPYPPDPPAPSTPAAPAVLCAVARCLQTRPGPTAAHRHRGQAPPPPTGAFGNSRETVIAFAGACSVSGETDGTIASQIHPFSALFHRAKASWVSWRRPEVPALVLMVSSHGAVSSVGAIKFAQRDLSMPIARQYSPSAGNMAQNGAFCSLPGEFLCACGRVGCLLGELCRALWYCNQASMSSTGHEARPSRASLPSIPAKPVTYADRLLRYG